MQQIERYGVIALLFLLVTIVVVALWDGGEPTQAAGPLTGGDDAAMQVTQRSDRERTDRRATPNRPRPEDRRTTARRTRDGMERVTLDPNRVRETANAASTADRQRRPYSNQGMANRAQSPVYQNPDAAKVAQAERRVEEPFSEASRRSDRTIQYDANGRPVQPFAAGGAYVPPASETVSGAAVNRVQQPQPVVQAQKTPVIPASGRTYAVQPGDSLERIARRELGDGDRWQEIQALNGISRPDKIQVGAILRLPSTKGVSPAAATQSAPVAQAQPVPTTNAIRGAQGTYTVQAGDILSRIAQKELGSAKRYVEIVKLNPGLDADRLITGQVLKMPAGSSAVAAQAKPAARQPKSGSVAKAQTKDSRYVVH